MSRKFSRDNIYPDQTSLSLNLLISLAVVSFEWVCLCFDACMDTLIFAFDEQPEVSSNTPSSFPAKSCTQLAPDHWLSCIADIKCKAFFIIPGKLSVIHLA